MLLCLAIVQPMSLKVSERLPIILQLKGAIWHFKNIVTSKPVHTYLFKLLVHYSLTVGWEHVTDDCPSHWTQSPYLHACNMQLNYAESGFFRSTSSAMAVTCSGLAWGFLACYITVALALAFLRLKLIEQMVSKSLDSWLCLLTSGRLPVHKHTWPGLENTAVKGPDNLAGLVKAVGLSKKHREEHSAPKSPQCGRF